MQLCSFSLIDQARKSYGIVQPDGVIDLGARLGDSCSDLKTLLQRGGLSDLQVYLSEPVDYAFSAIRFLPVVENPGKVFCVGMNYADKRQEFAATLDAPTLFVRFADSLAAHEQPLLKPATTAEFDYEGELAVIIGKAGRAIAEADALSHVAGYACYNDGSIRDWQNHTTQFTPGKNFPGTGGFGPWLITADEAPPVEQMSVTTRLNGQVVQNASCSLLIFNVAQCIAYISAFTELRPGDVISTGTPGGVGAKRTPPLWMKAGDKVEVEIAGVGLLRNLVVDEA